MAIKTVIGPTLGGGNVEDFQYEWCYVNTTSGIISIEVLSPIRLAVGDFDEDSYDEVVVAYIDGTNRLQVRGRKFIPFASLKKKP